MKSFLRLVAHLKNYRTNVFLNIGFNILTVIFTIISLILIKPFLEILFDQTDVTAQEPVFSYSVTYLFDYLNYYLVQYIDLHGKSNALIWVCSMIVSVFFLKNLFRYFAVYCMASVRAGVVRDIRNQIFQKLLNLPLSFFSEERKGDLMGRVTADVQEVEWSILRILEVIVKEPLAILGSLYIMITISPSLTIFAFMLILFIGLVIGQLGKTLKKKSLAVQNKLGDTLSVLDEALGGLRIIKAFNAEGYQMNKFDQENSEVAKLTQEVYRRNMLASPLSEFLGISVMVILLWFGGGLVFDGQIKASDFFVFIGMFYNIIAPAKSFSGAFYSIQKGMGASERIDKILDAEITIVEKPNAQSLASFEKGIAFENVSFSYDGDFTVLDKVNLDIPKGKIVALVGMSGAGKSTLADMIPRFYDIQTGEITIDNINIKDYKVKDLRSLMGIVSQEPILFNDTIFNNIAFGVLNATEASVIEAAKIANAHEFILNTENGYQTVIGDRGSKLSGGQRQRLTIARAVLKNPPILILDEATSSLDSESEKLVQEALFKLMQNRTSIVIAHRLSTIQHADEIVVMQDGKIMERGNHENLLKLEGIYQKLVHLQSI